MMNSVKIPIKSRCFNQMPEGLKFNKIKITMFKVALNPKVAFITSHQKFNFKVMRFCKKNQTQN